MSKKWIIGLVSLCIVLAIILTTVIGGTIIGAMEITMSIKKQINEHKPQIGYGEFPFEVTYKINDETITVKDIYVCEFDGIGWSTGSGFHRKWKGYIKNTKKEKIIVTTFTEDDINIEIQIGVGNAKYYMGDNSNKYYENIPRFYQISHFPNEKNSIKVIDDEYMERFSLKIIDYNMSAPIVNTFGTEKNN